MLWARVLVAGLPGGLLPRFAFRLAPGAWDLGCLFGSWLGVLGATPVCWVGGGPWQPSDIEFTVYALTPVGCGLIKTLTLTLWGAYATVRYFAREGRKEEEGDEELNSYAICRHSTAVRPILCR